MRWLKEVWDDPGQRPELIHTATEFAALIALVAIVLSIGMTLTRAS